MILVCDPHCTLQAYSNKLIVSPPTSAYKCNCNIQYLLQYITSGTLIFFIFVKVILDIYFTIVFFLSIPSLCMFCLVTFTILYYPGFALSFCKHTFSVLLLFLSILSLPVFSFFIISTVLLLCCALVRMCTICITMFLICVYSSATQHLSTTSLVSQS